MNRLRDVLRARNQLRRAAAGLDGGWVVQRVVHTVSQTAVAHVGTRSGQSAVLKVATGSSGQAALRREAQVLRLLRHESELGGWQRLLPLVLHDGVGDSPSHLLLSRLPGRTGRASGIASSTALATLDPLHRLGGAPAEVGGLLGRVVEEPAALLRPLLALPDRAGLDRLVETLYGALSDRTAWLGWVHGDLHPGNLLFDSSGAVSGIVDWEQARPLDLPVVDVAFWLLTTAPGHQPLGRQVAARLGNGCWSSAEARTLAAVPGDEPLPARAVLLLAWLRHVAGNLSKADRYASSGRWLAHAVSPVVRAIPCGVPVPAMAVSRKEVEIGPVAVLTKPPVTERIPQQRVIRRSYLRSRLVDGRSTAKTIRQLARDRRTSGAMRLAALRLAVLAVALVLWAISLNGVSIGSMTNLGLVSVLPVEYWIGLGLLVVAAAVLINGNRAPDWVLGAYVAAVVVVLHATPAILYGTPRYAWTWKHIGVVDFIVRHGAIHPHLPGLFSAYMGWPGFFALNAVVVKGGHLSSALSYAAWGPPVFELAALIPLRLIYGTLLTNRRQIWLALLIFYLGNWVGQDYFSPQAFSYVLDLVVLVVCLRWLPSTAQRPVGRWRDRLLASLPGRPAQRPERRIAVALVIVLMLAIVSSHQLTPFMLLTALCVLVVTRASGPVWLPPLLLVLTIVWIATMAWGYLGQNLYWIVASIGHPAANTQTTFVSLGDAGIDQRLVDWADRGLTAALVFLAAIGWLRARRAGASARLPALLALSPVPLLVANNYGGEMLFRVYLFALPWLALLAAAAIYPGGSRHRHRLVRRWRAGIPVALVVVLATVFSIAYYGKEKMNYFPPAEVRASRWLYAHATSGSTVLAASANFPWAFERLNDFQYLFLEDLPATRKLAIAREPVSGIRQALGVNRPAYVVLAVTQQTSGTYAGTLPSGLVAELQHRLPSAADFHIVYRDTDTTIVETGGP